MAIVSRYETILELKPEKPWELISAKDSNALSIEYLNHPGIFIVVFVGKSQNFSTNVGSFRLGDTTP